MLPVTDMIPRNNNAASRFSTLVVALLTGLLIHPIQAGKPAPAHYYPHQLVDHLSSNDDTDNGGSPYQGKQWSQRYYTWPEHFQGPGHPIFLIMGGEGHISPSTGIYYPFVSDYLAKDFGGFVLQPEHRFYGFSQPLAGTEFSSNKERSNERSLLRSTNSQQKDTKEEVDPRVELFTSEQALMDYVRLVQHVAQDQLHCSPDKTSKDYCPVITVGG